MILITLFVRHLKIGLLAPFSGEYRDIGQSIMLSLQLALKEIGEDVGWVTHKWPLLTILLPAILPMIMLGDPFVYMLAPLLE